LELKLLWAIALVCHATVRELSSSADLRPLVSLQAEQVPRVFVVLVKLGSSVIIISTQIIRVNVVSHFGPFTSTEE
jgi:hypothetical protein